MIDKESCFVFPDQDGRVVRLFFPKQDSSVVKKKDSALFANSALKVFSLPFTKSCYIIEET